MLLRKPWLLLGLVATLAVRQAAAVEPAAPGKSRLKKAKPAQQAKADKAPADAAPADADPVAAEATDPVAAEAAVPAASPFIRLARDGDGEVTAMETAIIRYSRPGKTKKDPELVVDLVGVVHIGEKAYYEKLNDEFTHYEALLYELVAPEGTKVPKAGSGEGTGSPVSAIQNGMKNILELEFQLDWIDYHKDNFVHADMSPDDFAKSMADRGENIWLIMFRMMGQAIAQQSKNPEQDTNAELLLALFDSQRALKLKRIMAKQFEDLEGAMNLFDGPDGSVIITERNKKALAVLERQIKDGKTNLAIFYGAGHMPDMEARLLKDFGLKRTEERWLTAWDLKGD